MVQKMTFERSDLERLVEARGPPGAEYAVGDVFTELIEPYVDTVSHDAMGNVIATQEGRDPDAPEILLAAHIDELAFIIQDITDDGFLRFEMLGGHYQGNFPGQRVRVGPEQVPGVIGAKSLHYMSDEERQSLPDTELYIDVGAESPAEVSSLNIQRGDYATWATTLTELANDRVAGRAMDDRVAAAMLVAVARACREAVDATVHFVATVQEEVGLRGARAVGANLDPDIALALEIFPADDYPTADVESPTVALDEGPVIELADGLTPSLATGLIVDEQTRAWLETASERCEIEPQRAVMQGITTDASELNQVDGGRHAGAIGVACRYTHSPVETISLTDVEETVDVVSDALQTPFPSRDDVRHQ